MNTTKVVPEKDTATVMLVTGRDEHGTPGSVAMNVKTGNAFSHFGRALGTMEADGVVREFAAWKKSIGPHEVVELNRGTASVHFSDEMALPASMGASDVDLASLLIGLSSILGQKLDPNTRLTAPSTDLFARAQQQCRVYTEVIRAYEEVAKIYQAARAVAEVWRSES